MNHYSVKAKRKINIRSRKLSNIIANRLLSELPSSFFDTEVSESDTSTNGLSKWMLHFHHRRPEHHEPLRPLSRCVEILNLIQSLSCTIRQPCQEARDQDPKVLTSRSGRKSELTHSIDSRSTCYMYCTDDRKSCIDSKSSRSLSTV